jgi:hypothetical protein
MRAVVLIGPANANETTGPPLSAATRGQATPLCGHEQLGLVREGGRLGRDEQGLVFGEALPKGLRIE